MNKGKIISLAYYGAVILAMLIAWYTLVSSDDAANPEAGGLLKLAMGLAVVVVFAALFAFIVNIVRNFGESKNMVIGLVVLLAIVLISYSLASPDILVELKRDPLPSDFADSRWSGAGLITTGIVAALTVLSAVFFGLKNVLNN